MSWFPHASAKAALGALEAFAALLLKSDLGNWDELDRYGGFHRWGYP